MSVKQSDWIKYFPFKTPRPEQVKSINYILDRFHLNSKFIILEGPLGIGKSAIAVTVSNYFHDKFVKDEIKASYIITTQKILQEQ